MTNTLLVAVVFLAVITLGNLLLIFAVIRRLRQLQDMVAPPIPMPEAGTAVQPFQLETVDGASITMDGFADAPVLVAVMSNTCPACQGLAHDLVSLPQAPIALIVADPQHENSKLLEALAGLDQVAVIGRDHPALTALGGVAAFPTLLVVREGVIVSAGISLDKVLPALHDRPHTATR